MLLYYSDYFRPNTLRLCQQNRTPAGSSRNGVSSASTRALSSLDKTAAALRKTLALIWRTSESQRAALFGHTRGAATGAR